MAISDDEYYERKCKQLQEQIATAVIDLALIKRQQADDYSFEDDVHKEADRIATEDVRGFVRTYLRR